MGTNKLLLPWGGGTVVGHAVDVAIAAGLAPVFVVVGFERDRVVAAVDPRVVVVVNEAPERGQHTSVAVGFAEARAHGADAAVLMLGDMPLVTTAMVRELVAAYRAQAEPVLAISRYGGVAAPPHVLGAGLFDEMCGLGEGGGKRVIERHLARAVTCEWPPERLVDLDVPGDLERARAFERT